MILIKWQRKIKITRKLKIKMETKRNKERRHFRLKS